MSLERTQQLLGLAVSADGVRPFLPVDVPQLPVDAATERPCRLCGRLTAAGRVWCSNECAELDE